MEAYDVDILVYLQKLDMQRGVRLRPIRFRNLASRETALRSRRLVRTQEPQATAIQMSPTAENRSGNIEIKSALKGRVTHAGAARYRGLDGQHLLFPAVRIGETGSGDGGVRFSHPLSPVIYLEFIIIDRLNLQGVNHDLYSGHPDKWGTSSD